ncbi:hypothetical protein [Candidatus Phyllobacterium onerii]|uniref:hypothetical protein n=1 Tax=Candidatus Phyllobacterium onerii TaxID=3020828 RepID=UPI00233055D9|nr:hypothetical protein [Phyllobacterium sp. IY22]
MATPPKVLYNPHTPDVFADNAIGTHILNGTVRVTFAVTRGNHSDKASLDHVVIGRLVMPTEAAATMARVILDHIDRTNSQSDAPENVTVQ